MSLSIFLMEPVNVNVNVNVCIYWFYMVKILLRDITIGNISTLEDFLVIQSAELLLGVFYKSTIGVIL